MNIPIEFQTPRLLLRQWKPTDREPFAALNADPLVMAHFPARWGRNESDDMADHCQGLIAEHRWGPWATAIKATGEFVGCVGLQIPQDDLPLPPCVEILWRLARAHWRQGFATEAARGALKIGFEMLQLPEIVAFTVPSNIRSRAVMERLGMRMDLDTFEHPGIPDGHALRTHCIYRLSSMDWDVVHRSPQTSPLCATHSVLEQQTHRQCSKIGRAVLGTIERQICRLNRHSVFLCKLIDRDYLRSGHMFQHRRQSARHDRPVFEERGGGVSIGMHFVVKLSFC